MVEELWDILIVLCKLESALLYLLSLHWHNAKVWRHAKNGYTECNNTIVATLAHDAMVTLP